MFLWVLHGTLSAAAARNPGCVLPPLSIGRSSNWSTAEPFWGGGEGGMLGGDTTGCNRDVVGMQLGCAGEQ